MFSPLRSYFADLIISFKLSPIIVPGPIVQGPPIVKTILGETGATSAKEMAILRAWPVALALLSLTVIV